MTAKLHLGHLLELPAAAVAAAGALFKALYKWFEESGPVYLLPTGPVSSFLVISDPAGGALGNTWRWAPYGAFMAPARSSNW
jgi:hypothetical protein